MTYQHLHFEIHPNFKFTSPGGAFWNAPLEGTDSKAGTIIHEASHFPEYAGTSDHAYGQSACRDLAKSDPGRAVMNAEYVAQPAEMECCAYLPPLIALTSTSPKMNRGWAGEQQILPIAVVNPRDKDCN